ncbi:hypothetical protein NDU88_001302 [Pleurodeles waltl]|uniref:Uncharacterized protein n=1 Tax=Pleurodeles waltl TaxID=8319 RepID=A0AAV7NFC3_PLEWA|nr:hypothetical protein NDU88_001302 [Pleurodeles waltl]
MYEQVGLKRLQRPIKMALHLHLRSISTTCPRGGQIPALGLPPEVACGDGRDNKGTRRQQQLGINVIVKYLSWKSLGPPGPRAVPRRPKALMSHVRRSAVRHLNTGDIRGLISANKSSQLEDFFKFFSLFAAGV